MYCHCHGYSREQLSNVNKAMSMFDHLHYVKDAHCIPLKAQFSCSRNPLKMPLSMETPLSMVTSKDNPGVAILL